MSSLPTASLEVVPRIYLIRNTIGCAALDSLARRLAVHTLPTITAGYLALVRWT